MKKNQGFKGFICGFLAAVVLIMNVPVLAASIDVIFNPLNIVINGVNAANKGENYTLTNGNEVPFSIVYKGTTYLPLRKLAELMGKDIVLDSETDTVHLNDPVATYDPKEEFPEKEGKVVSNESKYITKAKLSRFLVQSFELSDNGTRYDLPDVEKDNEYYIDICIAMQHEYIFPNTKGYFEPQYQLTRRQYLYTMLYRVYKLNIDEGQTVTKEIVKDADKYSDQLLKEIGAALELGLLPLYEDGTFRLYDPLVMDLTPNKELQKYLQR